jgi:hypothetical protein
MAMDQIDDRVLEGASMVHDLFDGDASRAIERRIAWALDCARIDDVMYWLAVRSALYGQPV